MFLSSCLSLFFLFVFFKSLPSRVSEKYSRNGTKSYCQGIFFLKTNDSNIFFIFLLSLSLQTTTNNERTIENCFLPTSIDSKARELMTFKRTTILNDLAEEVCDSPRTLYYYMIKQYPKVERKNHFFWESFNTLWLAIASCACCDFCFVLITSMILEEG